MKVNTCILNNKDGVLTYLQHRGINKSVISAEKLEYYPYIQSGDNSSITNNLQTKSFNPDIYFKGYIVLPIFNPIDPKELISYTARNFSNPRKNAPKHKHFPGTNNVLMGQSSVNKHLNELFIVEGLFDYLTAKVLKLNVVGLLGVNNFKSCHVDFITQNFNKVFLFLDIDQAGNLAAEKIARKLYREASNKLKQINIFRLTPRKGKDLNEWYNIGFTMQEFITTCKMAEPMKIKKEKKEKVTYNKQESNTGNTTEELLELAQQIGTVEKSGDKWKMICVNPMHNDTICSLYLYPNNKGLWCFGCGLKSPNEFKKYIKQLIKNEKG